MLEKMWIKGNPCALLVGMQTVVQPLGKSMDVSQKSKRELPYDPTIPLWSTYRKKKKTLTGKDICTHMFTVALFTIAKIWKQLKCPSKDEWIKKLWDGKQDGRVEGRGFTSSHKNTEITTNCWTDWWLSELEDEGCKKWVKEVKGTNF